MIAILDCGSGNISAIANILKQSNADFVVAHNCKDLVRADKYILPGVGHFDETMKMIRELSFVDVLEENVIGRRKPFLGICVGMQILADASEEGQSLGLGWIPGSVQKIRTLSPVIRLPHMGWNSIVIHHDRQGLLKHVDVKKGFYFLHSYHFVPKNSEAICATTEYGNPICCAVTNGSNIFGIQFHPEKSHRNGVSVFKNFINM